jgi:hypothetical protein
MAPLAIWFGMLMIILGGGLYATSVMRGVYLHGEAAGHMMTRALTALIPAGFGLLLIVLGLVARSGSDKTRMHAMHVAALLALLGVALPLWRVIKALTADTAIDWLPVGGNIAMIVLSGVFLILCVKTFIDARILRKQKEAQNPVK